MIRTIFKIFIFIMFVKEKKFPFIAAEHSCRKAKERLFFLVTLNRSLVLQKGVQDMI